MSTPPDPNAPTPTAATPPNPDPGRRRIGVLRALGVVLALCGWWISLDLYRLAGGAPATNPLVARVCGGEAAAGDCRSVLASEQAWVSISPQPGAPRIPLSIFGMAYFASISLWFLFVGRPTGSRWAWHVPLAIFLGIGVLSSANSLYVMGAVLHRWCAGCVAVHVINGVLALLAIAMFPWRRGALGTLPHPSGALAGAALVAGVAVFLLHPAWSLLVTMGQQNRLIGEAYQKIVRDPAYAKWSHARLTPREIPVRGDDLVLGPADAIHTAVVFADFQCESCLRLSDICDEVIEKANGRLRVAVRHYPIDRSCNPDSPRTMHAAACRAALAFEAARIAGGTHGAARMRLMLYARQSQLDSADLAAWAVQAGVDAGAFAEALRSDAAAARLRDDLALAKSLGVTSAPTVFLDGRRFDSWSSVEAWLAIVGE